MERPSQRLIAKKLGVSIAAVSLALRDTGTISPKLSAKIKAAAEEIGYRPNPILASLASKRFRNSEAHRGIPLTVLAFTRTALYNDGLSRRADELGYNLTFLAESDLNRYSNPCKTLLNRGVQGLVALGEIPQKYYRESFNWDEFSVVQCGRYANPMPFNVVRPNIFSALRLAYHKAKDLGYKRIGFAVGKHDPIIQDDEARICAAYGFSILESQEEDRIVPYMGNMHDIDLFVEWAKEHLPDCVIGFHLGQCAGLIAAGIKVPDDMGFACLHLLAGDTLGDEQQLTIAGVNQDQGEIARQTIDLLDQQIRHHVKGFVKKQMDVLIPSFWQDGDSLPDRT